MRRAIHPGQRADASAAYVGAPPVGRSVFIPSSDSLAPSQSCIQTLSVWEARGRVLGKAPQHNRFQPRRDIGSMLGQWQRLLVNVCTQHLDRRSAGEWRLPR